MITSSYKILALRFMGFRSFLYNLQVFQRPVNVCGLLSLSPAAKQYIPAVTRNRPVSAQSIAFVNPTRRLQSPKFPTLAGCYWLQSSPVRGHPQLRQPIVEDIFPASVDVVTISITISIVTYKLQHGNSTPELASTRMRLVIWFQPRRTD
jgi:hypothetical protein